MLGDPRVIAVLNEVLTGELTAINQYFVHSKMCENWGYRRIASHFREESIGEMKDADALIERILFLEGHPNVQRLSGILIGERVAEQFEADAELERAAIARVRAGIALCTEADDHGSRELLEHILVGEESHLDWVETQLHLMGEVGESNYLSQQLHS